MVERISSRARAAKKGGPWSSPGGSYPVGYGKPPKQHQFKPGQSGNSKGRPKGAKNTSTLLREILDGKIDLRTGASVRKVSVREAILLRIAQSALKGEIKSAHFLLQRYDAETTQAEVQETEVDIRYESTEEAKEALAKEGLIIDEACGQIRIVDP
jgi:Family of unknown function (DUF5681)